MSFTLEEIRYFNSQINISPNIVYNSIKSLSDPLKNGASFRIYYFINENNEILLNNKNENLDNFNNYFFYEIFIIKIDLIKKKSKMIMIYNNEKKQYKIKIWASKVEKAEIKNEYNIIIKKICERKTGNNILKNILKLNPDKYTIYYFPLSVTLFEKELIFIYILIFTQNQKSKFQNFKQIKDLISYSKSFLIPKIKDLLLKQNYKVKNKKSYNNIKKPNLLFLINDNKENILINNLQRNRSKNLISPKNQEIHIKFDEEKIKKAKNKKVTTNTKKILNFMKKPYNKIVFNYSFEKNDNESNLNKMKKYQKSFIEQRKPINTIIIDKNKNKTNKTYKTNNFMNFPFIKIKKLNHEEINNNYLPFSIKLKNSDNNNSLPYEKKRPSSIPKKIMMHYLSTNNFNFRNNNYCIEYDKDSNNQANYCTFENKSFINQSKKKIIYKRKSFTKKRSQETIDTSNFFNNLNNNLLEYNNSTFDHIDVKNIFNLDNNGIKFSKNKKPKKILRNGSMASINPNPLIKSYGHMNDNKEKLISKIPINKKTILNINFNKYLNQPNIYDFQLNGININNGNKTSRNILNKKIRREFIYRQGNNYEQNRLNRTGGNHTKINDSEEEITLFI